MTMNNYGWYGVVFSLEQTADEKIKIAKEKLENGDNTDFLFMEISIYMNLSKALRAGLERSHEYDIKTK